MFPLAVSEVNKIMNNSSLDLSIEQYAEYKKNGLLRLSLPSTSQVFLDGFLLEIALWLNHFAGIKVAATDIPTEIPKIAAKDRNLIALLYKVSRRFPSVK